MAALLEILGILFLWIAIPLVIMRLVSSFRATVPRWERGVVERLQRLGLICLIIAIPIIALYLFIFLENRAAVRRWMRGEGEYAPPRIVRRLRRWNTDPAHPFSPGLPSRRASVLPSPPLPLIPPERHRYPRRLRRPWQRQ
jgi:hypothetical protein